MGVSPSDAHEGAENLSPSIAIIRMMPQATVVFLLHRLESSGCCVLVHNSFTPLSTTLVQCSSLCMLVSINVSLVVLKYTTLYERNGQNTKSLRMETGTDGDAKDRGMQGEGGEVENVMG